tara:strand:- start:242 stop:613 length:372 start_codon:yes stop_codon:yes gene_type:complete
MSRLIATIILLLTPVVSFAAEAYMCTAENDDKFVVDLEQGVRTIWHGLFKIEIDGSWLGRCSLALPFEEHITCENSIFASDSRADLFKIVFNLRTREFIRFDGGWNGDVKINSSVQEGFCIKI